MLLSLAALMTFLSFPQYCIHGRRRMTGPAGGLYTVYIPPCYLTSFPWELRQWKLLPASHNVKISQAQIVINFWHVKIKYLRLKLWLISDMWALALPLQVLKCTQIIILKYKEVPTLSIRSLTRRTPWGLAESPGRAGMIFKLDVLTHKKRRSHSHNIPQGEAIGKYKKHNYHTDVILALFVSFSA